MPATGSPVAEPATRIARPLVQTLDPARALELVERCAWTELALERQGFTGERLQRTAYRVTADYIRLNIPYLSPERREELASYVTEKALLATMRFRPDHPTTSYTTRGGSHYESWICDVIYKRCTDWMRSKHEGQGDRRYGNDNRVVLADDPDPADHDVDFEGVVDERRRARWQQAAAATGWSLEEWVAISLDRAAAGVLRS